jgi:iron complex outermembrane receptor protein
MNSRTTGAALIGCSLLALTQPARAQTTPATPAPAPAAEPLPQSTANTDPAPDGQNGPDIVVTGSRIRGTGPVGSNVISVGQKELRREPAATITEFLRKVPQVEGFGVDASSPAVSGGQGGTNTTRGSSINLRGLGPQATLTLVDGQRLSFSGVSSNYVDATAIPSIAIERIEIVADGASAVYGSDAVAGVANFILRKDYNGLEARGRYGFADGYWTAQGGVLAGKNWGSGQLVLAYEFAKHDNLNGGERDYVKSDLTAFGGSDFRNGQCNPGNIVIGSTNYAIPAGGVTPATANLLAPNTFNRCENLRFADILPKETRNSGYGYLSQELAKGLKFHLEGLYTSRTYLAEAVQQGSTSNIVNLSVPSTNPYYVRPVGSTATTETVQYDFTKELGLINQTGYTRSLFLTGGLTWDISSKWHVSADGFYSSDRSAQVTKRVNTTALTAALRSTDPATAFNPYGGTNSQSVLDSVFSGIFFPYATSRTRGGSVEVNGDLFALPGGDVRLAAGAEFVRYTADAGSQQGALSAPTLVPTPKLSRNQKSVYGELFVPLFGASNEMPGLRRLELSAAYRYDDYDDVGSTTNPKIGINWSPVKGLLFKGSYGTSFRAPGLQDLLLLRSGASLTVATWTDPTSPTGTSVGLQLNAGNPNLTPETAKTWSFTAELTPPGIPGLTLSSTFFSIDYRGLIAYPPATTSSLLNANYAFVVTRNPTAAQIQSYTSQGIPINGVLPPVVAFLYDGSAQNLGSVRTKGIDFNAKYDFDLGASKLSIGANGTYVLDYKFQVTKVATAIDETGVINFPVDFRARGFLGWQLGGISADATLNFTDGYSNNLATVVQKVHSWTTLDLNLGYTFKEGLGALSGLSLGLDITNLFDRDPPFVNIQGGWDPGQANAVGRLISFSIAKKF